MSIIHKNKAQVDDLPKKIIKGTLQSHFSYRNISKRGNNKKILQELYAPLGYCGERFLQKKRKFRMGLTKHLNFVINSFSKFCEKYEQLVATVTARTFGKVIM